MTDIYKGILTEQELDGMDDLELVRLANTRYALNVSTQYQHAELVGMIFKAQKKFKGNADVSIVDEDDDTKLKPGFIKVRVQPGNYNPKNRPIFISHQFKPATVPVNVDVVMPAKYENCLKDAIRSEYFMDDDTNQLIKQNVHSYPFSVIERG